MKDIDKSLHSCNKRNTASEVHVNIDHILSFLCDYKLDTLKWFAINAVLVNFDGASKGNPGQAGFGCVLRDHGGSMVHVVCGPLGVCDTLKAEAMGFLMELREMKCMGVTCGKVEGDSKVIISWAKGKEEGS